MEGLWKSEKRLGGVKQELDAKIEALLAQASDAKPEVRQRIEQRLEAYFAAPRGWGATVRRTAHLAAGVG